MPSFSSPPSQKGVEALIVSTPFFYLRTLGANAPVGMRAMPQKRWLNLIIGLCLVSPPGTHSFFLLPTSGRAPAGASDDTWWGSVVVEAFLHGNRSPLRECNVWALISCRDVSSRRVKETDLVLQARWLICPKIRLSVRLSQKQFNEKRLT